MAENLQKTELDALFEEVTKLKEDCFKRYKLSEIEYSDILGQKVYDAILQDDAQKLEVIINASSSQRFEVTEKSAFFYKNNTLDGFIDRHNPDRYCTSIFHFTLASGSIQCAKLLLNLAKKHQTLTNLLNLRSNDDLSSMRHLLKQTPFEFITQVYCKHPEDKKIELVELLLAYGANPYAEDENAKSKETPIALQFANMRHETKLAEVLKKAYREWDKAHPVHRTKILQFFATLGGLLPIKQCIQKQALEKDLNASRQHDA